MTETAQIMLCPYCGRTQSARNLRCEGCAGHFDPLSLMATQIDMGPWFVRDETRPFRPGCSYEQLKQLIEAKKIHPTTVLRGPTTRQLWSIAQNIPGVAHLLGICHACGDRTGTENTQCQNCGESFSPVEARNTLGLLYPTREAADTARLALERRLDAERNRHGTNSQALPEEDTKGTASPGADLLQEILGSATVTPPDPSAQKTTALPQVKANLAATVQARNGHFHTAGDAHAPGVGPEEPQRHTAPVQPADSGSTPVPRRVGMNRFMWWLIIFEVIVLAMLVVLFVLWFGGGEG